MEQRISFDRALAELHRDYLALLDTADSLGALVHQAVHDTALRERLQHAPRETLTAKGVAVSVDTEIEFLASTARRPCWVLPPLSQDVPVAATRNPLKRAIARACSDAAYRAVLLNERDRALAEEHCELPEGVQLSVHETSNRKLTVVLPEQVDDLLSGSVDGSPQGLSLEWRQGTLIAAGRVDAITAPALRRELERARFDVDLVLAAVTFLSSAGLGALLAGQKHLAAHGRALRLIDVPEAVCTVLETVGFTDLFEIVCRERYRTEAARSWTDAHGIGRLFLAASTCTRPYGRLRPQEAASVSFADVQRARERIGNRILATPLTYSKKLSAATGCRLFLKLENLQMTGAYKERGALSKMLGLSEQQRRAGIVTCSAGNHAQAVAYAAERLGVDATVVMPETTPLSKVLGTQAFGASIVLHGNTYDAAYQKAKELERQHGHTFVHAFDDPAVIAGQGTIGLELLEQNPYLDMIVAPIGGGGLISGISIAVKETNPKIRIVGVEAAAMAGMHASLAAGKVTTIGSASTIAEGVAVATVGSHTFPIVQKYVDDIVTVTEEEIASAILLLLEQEKTLAEGAGAVGLAALSNGKIEGAKDKNVAVIISGGNIDLNMLSRILERGFVKDGRLAHLKVIAPDKPASLVGLGAVLAEQRANVLQIRHERSLSQAHLGEVQVSLTLETRGKQHVQEISAALSRSGFRLITA